MVTSRRRSRLTRVLLDLAWKRFHACDVCDREAPIFIEEALAPLRLKQRELKRLFRQLTCPCCESPVRAGTFVVPWDLDELRRARFARRFEEDYGALLGDFREFLIKYPKLGAVHPFGKLLSKVMKSARTTVLGPSVWYHAKSLQRKPPHNNRYNEIGQESWYLAGDNKTAAVEVMREPRTGEKVRIDEIELGEPVEVLDLRSLVWGEDDPVRQWILRNVVDSGFISEPSSDQKGRPEYLVPEFIADLARTRRVRGILYDSTRPSPQNNPNAVGHNLVIFGPRPQHFTGSQSMAEFGELGQLEDDPFCPELWPLRIVSTTG